MEPNTMMELTGIFEPEENNAEYHKSNHRKSKSKSRDRKRRHKLKMAKAQMSGFEKRFKELALEGKLLPEEKRIDFVLVHKHKSADDYEDKEDKDDIRQQELDRAKFNKLMQKEGFIIQNSAIGELRYTKLFCPFKRLCREAERVKTNMPLKNCQQMEDESESCFAQFIRKKFETDNEEDFVSTAFIMNKIEKFEGHENPNTFFRPAQRCSLTYHILINIDLDSLDDNLEPSQKGQADDVQNPQEKKGLPYMLKKKNYTDYFILHDESELSSARGDWHHPSADSASVKPPEESELDQDPRKELDETWTKFFKFQPLWKIRNYFGECFAFYFAWSGMLSTTLWVPTILGFCIFLYGIYESTTADTSISNSTSLSESFKDLFGDFKQSFDNDATPYFGLFICVWGTVFLEIWKRKNAELAFEWDVEEFEATEPDRPSFSGTESKQDPVTEEWIWYYPSKQRCMKYLLSVSILVVMIMLVLISAVSIITYRVFIDIDYCPGASGAECLVLSTIISSVLNAISILILSRLYNVLARILTDWENHRTQTRYDDALIFKLFAFQFVNNYSTCFYIAFFQGNSSLAFLDGDKYKDSCNGSCMTKLSFQVFILMLLKPMPKFLNDVVLVWVKKMWNKYPNCCKCIRRCPCCKKENQVRDMTAEGGEGDGIPTDPHTLHLMYLKHEHDKPTVGDFTLDEYTEKVIQYGFLMLFATSFPLAPLLALLTNLIDIRVDARRLLWWYRRPVAVVAQDIGMWFDILLFVNFCGVVSNAFLIAFTSSWGHGYSTTGKLIIVLAFEHIVFCLKYLVAYIIPDVPNHVRLAIRREQYQIQKKMEEPEEDIDYNHLYPGDGPDGRLVKPKSGKGVQGMSSKTAQALPQQDGNKSTFVTYLNTNASKDTPRKIQSGTPGSLVSTSDVKPQGKGAQWEMIDEVETIQAPSMRVHSATYRSKKNKGQGDV